MGKMTKSVIRMISKAIKYIPNSRIDKGREIRLKSELNNAKISQKKQNKMELAAMNHDSEKDYIPGCRRDRGKRKGDKRGKKGQKK